MDEYTNSNKINIIIILMINLRFVISSNKNNSISIRRCQVFEIDGLDKDDINNMGQNIMAS